jgi:23S rRNA pseudouridine2605 synthase
MDLVPVRERVVPAGRLDYLSEGLVLLTNDGEVIRAVTRAGACAKVYLVKIRGELAEKDRQRLERGVRVEGAKLAPCRIALHRAADNCWYQVTLFQGVNRQIRRMFAREGYLVSKIKRIAIGPIQLAGLKTGECRRLREEEVAALLRLSSAGKVGEVELRRAGERASGRAGEGATRGHSGGGAGTRRCGGHGDAGTRGHGDAGTRGCGDAGTRGCGARRTHVGTAGVSKQWPT